jgi:hypothetical protein
MKNQSPRMLGWALLTVVLISIALFVHEAYPGTLLAVTLYKAHLMALGGWGGYWLDRALFPYDRPHQYLQLADDPEEMAEDLASAELVASSSFGHAMLRRAIIVAACLICVGLGA